MRPLQILHVTPYGAEAWAYGGIPRVAATLSRELARAGHAVTVCTTDAHTAGTRDRAHHSPSVSAPAAGSVSVHVFPNLSNRAAYHAQAFLPIGLGRFLAGRARSFDVAHLHACRNVPGLIAARHLRRAGVPYVVAPNGTAVRIERRQLIKTAFDAAAGHRLLAGASRVMAVSRAESASLAQLGIAPSLIRLLPNPVDLDEVPRDLPRGPWRQRRHLGADPLVLFLGKLTPRKRVEDLVRAVAVLGRERVRLVVAGNDMGAGGSIRRAASALGLAGRVVFTGLLTGTERFDALADADVVVYPSEHEAFGLVPLEALLAGTPVVVGDDSGCGEIVSAVGGGRLVPTGNPLALANAIADVLDHPAEWRAAARAAAARVQAAYGGAAVARELAGVYGEIAAGRPA
jgi:glycosyltransferase involved in cell wall biosynthesis